ncbi:MAG: DUF2207 domain-containing protein [Endomicrobium sp.]|jgi:uncharacterized membrane protein YgcG|nr:DUF2207 domain-containing protein [Endomicrobium sp.]
MKKFFFLLFSILLLCACTDTLRADEKIRDFACVMTVNNDGSITVEETIAVNAENIKIRRGIYKDIPDSASNPVKFISLYMDGQPHPSFMERRGKNLRINFGDDNYISKGVHVYKLTYSVDKIAQDFEDYDEIYWNVTGNYWDFTIVHASFRIILPEGADIKDELVSLYTGTRGSKDSNAVKNGKNYFETTKPLYAGEGFTIAVPFTKGIVQSYKQEKALPAAAANTGLLMSVAVFLLIIFIVYFIASWTAVGRDPKDVIVTEFAPPKNISPAFIRCLWIRKTDKKMFATALVSIAMKGKIEICEEKKSFQKTAVLKLKDKNTDGLSEEEVYIIRELFAKGDEFTITNSNWSTLSSCMSHIEKKFNDEKKKYIESNVKYRIPAVIILILFQLLFISLGAQAAAFIFVNLHYCIFMLVFVGLPKNKIFKAIAFIVLNLFYTVFFLGILRGADIHAAAAVIQGCFLLSFWALLVYINIIDNLTAEGRELFKHIKGFYRYMTIAEEHRVAMSVPIDDERIFADYLPYAFAFDMENKWMKRFEKILSQATIDRYTHNIGGRNFLASRLIISSINSSAPRSSGSGGSGGRGFSGGGFGGGGGGGR